MKYRQLNGEERSELAALRLVGLKPAEIARELGRHRSTVSRELKRNAAPYDGWYRARRAQQRAYARRYRSRRNSQFGRRHWNEWKSCCGKSGARNKSPGTCACSAS